MSLISYKGMGNNFRMYRRVIDVTVDSFTINLPTDALIESIDLTHYQGQMALFYHSAHYHSADIKLAQDELKQCRFTKILDTTGIGAIKVAGNNDYWMNVS